MECFSADTEKNDIGYERALAAVLDNVTVMATEIIPLSRCVGRMGARAVTARIDSPSADVSLKDGYAVVSEDIERASENEPVRLRLIGTASAGDGDRATLTPGCAIRILSGAQIPVGATAVLAEEFADAERDYVTARADAEPGRNILRRGTDVARDEAVIRPGDVITPGKVSLLAAGGITEVPVHRRPRTTLLGVGDEVLLPGQTPREGTLYASNLTLQHARLSLFGIESRTAIAPDDADTLAQAISDLLPDTDILITSGGAWKGDRDLVVKVLDRLGWELIFHRVRVGPGKAVGMGLLHGRTVFCLPGGPPSNEVAFLMLALPAIHRTSGMRGCGHVRVYARLIETVRGQSDWTQFIHCRMERGDGEWTLIPLPMQRRLQSMARADAMVKIPEGTECIEAGTTVECVVLDPASL